MPVCAASYWGTVWLILWYRVARTEALSPYCVTIKATSRERWGAQTTVDNSGHALMALRDRDEGRPILESFTAQYAGNATRITRTTTDHVQAQ